MIRGSVVAALILAWMVRRESDFIEAMPHDLPADPYDGLARALHTSLFPIFQLSFTWLVKPYAGDRACQFFKLSFRTADRVFGAVITLKKVWVAGDGA